MRASEGCKSAMKVGREGEGEDMPTEELEVRDASARLDTVDGVSS